MAEIPLEKLVPSARVERLRRAVAATFNRFPADFGQRSKWELYEPMKVLFNKEAFEGTLGESALTGEIEIRDELLSQLQAATARHRSAEKEFEEAKRNVTSRLGYSWDYDSGSVLAAVRFIADCMRADGHGILYGWNQEKASNLSASAGDLVRRSNAGHPGFIASTDKIRGILYVVHAPKVWAQPPPTYGRA